MGQEQHFRRLKQSLRPPFPLDSLTRALYVELVDRHNLDRRWHNARSDFLREQFRIYGMPSWPYRAAA